LYDVVLDKMHDISTMLYDVNSGVITM